MRDHKDKHILSESDGADLDSQIVDEAISAVMKSAVSDSSNSSIERRREREQLKQSYQ